MRKTLLLRSLLLLVLPLAALACGDDDDLTGPEVGGTYALVSVNGNPLPAKLLDANQDGFHIVVNAKSGSLTLNDGQFNAALQLEAFLNGEPLDDPEVNEPATGSGTYTVSGSTITFKDAEDGSTFTGTIDGGTITVSDTDPEFGTITMVFRK